MSSIINSDILKKFYNHKNKVAQMLSEDEKHVLEYFLRSEKMDYLYENDAGNPKYTEYNRLFLEHCRQHCCLTERDGCICLLHRAHSIYCFIRHLMNKTDYSNCYACSFLRQEEKESIKKHYSTQAFQKDGFLSIVNHIKKCQGCWKCKQFQSAHVNSTSQRSSNTESELMPVPNGLFYTQESDQPNHSGYLRIIPLAYENDQNTCDDYADLVTRMNSNRKYRDERDFAYKRIENEEREFRSFIKLDDLIIQQMKKKYGVEMNMECIEELSLAVNKYLFHIVNCCKLEQQSTANKESSTVDENIIKRVLRNHPYCVSSTFSL